MSDEKLTRLMKKIALADLVLIFLAVFILFFRIRII